MTEPSENLYQKSLKVFGKVTASLSHEIKNALAVMNENAGLLEDITYMADKGKPIEPERLNQLAGTLSRQIERVDGLIKNMNRFSHSMDEWVKQINLNDIVSLMILLTGRLASMKRVTLTPQVPADPVMITTHIMFLESLLYLCIQQAVHFTEQGKKLLVSVTKTQNGADIRFSGLDGLSSETITAFKEKEADAFLKLLKADVKEHAAGGEFTVCLPHIITI